jgi:hypothetical protein
MPVENMGAGEYNLSVGSFSEAVSNMRSMIISEDVASEEE